MAKQTKTEQLIESLSMAQRRALVYLLRLERTVQGLDNAPRFWVETNRNIPEAVADVLEDHSLVAISDFAVGSGDYKTIVQLNGKGRRVAKAIERDKRIKTG